MNYAVCELSSSWAFSPFVRTYIQIFEWTTRNQTLNRMVYARFWFWWAMNTRCDVSWAVVKNTSVPNLFTDLLKSDPSLWFRASAEQISCRKRISCQLLASIDGGSMLQHCPNIVLRSNYNITSGVTNRLLIDSQVDGERSFINLHHFFQNQYLFRGRMRIRF